MKYSEPFEKAMEILGRNPLPVDTAEQLAKLQQQIPEKEQLMFGDLWSAYYAAGGDLDPGDLGELPKWPPAK